MHVYSYKFIFLLMIYLQFITFRFRYFKVFTVTKQKKFFYTSQNLRYLLHNQRNRKKLKIFERGYKLNI